MVYIEVVFLLAMTPCGLNGYHFFQLAPPFPLPPYEGWISLPSAPPCNAEKDLFVFFSSLLYALLDMQNANLVDLKWTV